MRETWEGWSGSPVWGIAPLQEGMLETAVSTNDELRVVDLVTGKVWRT